MKGYKSFYEHKDRQNYNNIDMTDLPLIGKMLEHVRVIEVY